MATNMLPIYCPLCCDQPFDDQQSLFFHLRGLRNNLFCSICSDKFPTLEALITHLSRKCNGPTSPSAKRKVLNISKESPASNPSTSQEVSKVVETVGQITSSSSPPHTEENASESSDEVEILQVIPPEIRNRLSKNITLTVEGINKPLKKEPVVFENKISTNPIKSSSGKEISVSEAVDKVLHKSGVELSLTVKENKNSNKSLQQNKNVQIKTNLDSSNSQQKPGPLSPKSNSPEKRKSETIIEECVKKKLHFSENHVTKPVQKKVIVGNQSSLVSTTTSLNDSDPENKRKRGRPRKEVTTEKEAKGREEDRKTSLEGNSLANSSLVKELNNSHQKLGNHHSALKDKHVTSQHYNSNNALKSHSKSLEINRKLIPIDPKKLASYTNNVSVPNSLANSSNKCNTTEERSHQLKSNTIKNNHIPQNNSGLANTKNSTSVQSTKGSKLEDKPEEKKSKEEKQSEDGEEEYTCSACNVRFTSIYDHIKKYHNGEEVVVEVPPDEIKEDLKAYQEDPGIKVAIETNTPDSTDSTQVKKDDAKKAVLELKSPTNKPAHTKPLLAGNKPNNNNKSPNNATLTQKIKEFSIGKWMHCPTNGKKGFYQYVRDPIKRKNLISELLESKTYHKESRIPMKDLFENPKINVIEITYEGNTPPITHKEVDFKKPMPMYIKEYKCNDEHDLLGGIASYVISSGTKRPCLPVPESSEIIAVMRVVLGSDKALTVENVSFKDKPANESMIPVLEEVYDPKIPLLLNAKILKWRCVKCLTLTWKFPLNMESHACNSCPVCHKTFASYAALKSHSMIHRKDGSKFCKLCQDTLNNRGLICKNLKHPNNYTLCDLCKLAVVSEQEAEHRLHHEQNPFETLPCSVCKKVFGSVPERKVHETMVCSRLVAKYNCSKCDKKFFSLTALNLHSKQHSICVQKFPCRFCKKVFILEKEMNTNIGGHKKPSSFLRRVWHERIHSRDRPFLCAACPKRFRSRTHHRTHFSSVHEAPRHVDVLTLECSVCDRPFTSQELLNSHLTSHITTVPSASTSTPSTSVPSTCHSPQL